jgi:hypothetical protein
MRLSLPLVLVVCLSGCLSSGWPTLASLTAWERGATIESAETRRVERLEVPRNAQLTFRAVATDAAFGHLGELSLHCRVHTMDGGMITWELASDSPPTEPIRAKWLKRLEVLVGVAEPRVSGRLTGAAALAEVPPTGALMTGDWERLSLAVAEVGGQVVLATQVPVYPGEEAAPGRLRRTLVFEGAMRGDNEAEVRVVSAVIELGIEIVDRDHRPKQKDRRAPQRHDPVREPPPRDFAAVR